ncbi:hypothetical protein KAZ66_04400 [Candidatus Woesebacteria bacterium]|nr:hypothetical protein [Candidatus Woesebacteria bacterium]
MQFKLEEIKKLFRYTIAYHVIAIYFVVIVFGIGALYISFILYNSWNTLSNLSVEVENYKSSVEFISKNRDLVYQNVDEYNKTLEALIPDEESYFSVVTALEKLASETGITIQSYTIDLESTNVSKLSLRVEVTATEESLEKILNNYAYTGGRLITIEKVELSNLGEARNVFLFNFYHQPYTVGTSVTQEKLTKKDIDLIEDIQSRMKP